MFGCSIEALVDAGCVQPTICAELLHDPLACCLLAGRDLKHPQKRQRSKPRAAAAKVELEPLDPRWMKRNHLSRLVGIKGADRNKFYSYLLEDAESFRSWTVQATFEASRAEDRAANLGFDKVAKELIEAIAALSGDDYAKLAARTPLIPAMPLHGKGEWLGNVAFAMQRASHQLNEMSVRTKALSKVAGHATTTAALFGALGNGRSYVTQHLRGESSRGDAGFNDPVAALVDALSQLGPGVGTLADAQALVKGPERNGNLRQFIVWVDDIVRRFRPKPLQPGAGYDRDTKGSSQSADDRFVLELLEMIFKSVPKCVRQVRPQLYSARAGLEALKLHAAHRNAHDMPLRKNSDAADTGHIS